MSHTPKPPPIHFEYLAECECGHTDPWKGSNHRQKSDAQTDADNHNKDHAKHYNGTAGCAKVKTIEKPGP